MLKYLALTLNDPYNLAMAESLNVPTDGTVKTTV